MIDMPKRITYLEKKDGSTESSFREHWMSTHAEIAKDLPGVIAYRQNHVVASVPKEGDSRPYAVDGIVELWFEDETAAGAGFGSDVADRLVQDEPEFLSGLVGSAVRASGPTPLWPGKIWLLGRWASGPDEGAAQQWAEELSDERFHGSGVSCNFQIAEAPLLVRSALRQDPAMAQAAIAFGFTTLADAVQAFPAAERALSECEFLSKKQLLLSEEIPIV